MLLNTFSISSHATGFTGPVGKIICHAASTSSLCRVSVNGEVEGESCATSGWDYTFDGATPEGKNLLSMLLAAHVSRQVVGISGTGTCTLSPDSENMQFIYISDE